MGMTAEGMQFRPFAASCVGYARAAAAVPLRAEGSKYGGTGITVSAHRQGALILKPWWQLACVALPCQQACGIGPRLSWDLAGVHHV